MAVVLFVVKASITPEQEEAFNRWYNEEHCPQLLQFRGAVSARRYKAIMGEHDYQYMAVYEFESDATFFRTSSRTRASSSACVWGTVTLFRFSPAW